MKKKRRRAVCFTIIGAIYLVALPFMLCGWCMEKLAGILCNFCDWLKTKLRVYDYDPD